MVLALIAMTFKPDADETAEIDGTARHGDPGARAARVPLTSPTGRLAGCRTGDRRAIMT